MKYLKFQWQMILELLDAMLKCFIFGLVKIFHYTEYFELKSGFKKYEWHFLCFYCNSAVFDLVKGSLSRIPCGKVT